MNTATASTPVDRVDATTTVPPFDVFTSIWESGSKTHILLLHGLGGNSITWHGVAPHLAQALDAKVVAVDMPGFGATRPGRRRLTLESFVDIVSEVLLAHAGPNVRWFVAGNSLGGLLALLLARKFPDRIQGISLAAGALPITWGRSFLQLLPLLGLLPQLAPWLGGALIARYSTRTGLPGVVDDPVEALFADPGRLAPELRDRLIALSGYRLTWAREAAGAYEQILRGVAGALFPAKYGHTLIESIRCPVQAIYGTKDPLYPVPCWEKLRQVRPDWHYVALDAVGHVPQLEAPEQVAAEMITWLRSARASNS
ncbi:MAG: alpha/beta hydrolase [Polyangiaceae bacterium]|nr:alpha/beta hydrolase [Polyangiaceae bacterium]